jgi:hypothetical protein
MAQGMELDAQLMAVQQALAFSYDITWLKLKKKWNR